MGARLGRSFLVAAGLVALVLLSSCSGDDGGEEGSAPLTFDELLADHRADFDAAVEDCGSVELGLDECKTSFSAQEQCLWDAYNYCTPAELELIVPTVDAGPMRTHLFVRMGNYGCEVDWFRDHTSDPSKGADYGDFTLDTCTQLQGDIPDPVACDVLEPLECTRTRDWWLVE